MSTKIYFNGKGKEVRRLVLGDKKPGAPVKLEGRAKEHGYIEGIFGKALPQERDHINGKLRGKDPANHVSAVHEYVGEEDICCGDCGARAKHICVENDGRIWFHCGICEVGQGAGMGRKKKWGKWSRAKAKPITVQDLLELEADLKKRGIIYPIEMVEGVPPDVDMSRFEGAQGGNDDD
jgi:hypothetical protein